MGSFTWVSSPFFVLRSSPFAIRHSPFSVGSFKSPIFDSPFSVGSSLLLLQNFQARPSRFSSWVFCYSSWINFLLFFYMIFKLFPSFPLLSSFLIFFFFSELNLGSSVHHFMFGVMCIYFFDSFGWICT